MDNVMKNALLGRRVTLPRTSEVIVISDVEVIRNFASLRLNAQYDITYADAQDMLAMPEAPVASKTDTPTEDPPTAKRKKSKE